VLLFFVPYVFIYFLIQSSISYSNFDLLTDIDTLIPFVPQFIWIYHTIIPALFFTTIILIKKKEVFFSALSAFLIAGIISSVFYILLPSFYPREPLLETTVSTFLVKLTRLVDGAHNTFPSGHVTYAWILALFVPMTDFAKNKLSIKFIYFLWAALVSVSTLFLKQHYIVDVLSGIILALICYHLSKSFIYVKLTEN
tara:strand:+ start:532 stop:1122 length:591 start_codon:yes stop_codon:yes gene_type:complete